eukprot:scaffold7797_cov147-Skeletonema_marinoi.AAC.1
MANYNGPLEAVYICVLIGAKSPHPSSLGVHFRWVKFILNSQIRTTIHINATRQTQHHHDNHLGQLHIMGSLHKQLLR